MAAQNNSNLKPKEVFEGVKKLDWDPSIQAMAGIPRRGQGTVPEHQSRSM
jgi:hypothetical protein